MWGKFDELKNKAVSGISTGLNTAKALAKDIILENLEIKDEEQPTKGESPAKEPVKPEQSPPKAAIRKPVVIQPGNKKPVGSPTKSKESDGVQISKVDTLNEVVQGKEPIIEQETLEIKNEAQDLALSESNSGQTAMPE